MTFFLPKSNQPVTSIEFRITIPVTKFMDLLINNFSDELIARLTILPQEKAKHFSSWKFLDIGTLSLNVFVVLTFPQSWNSPSITEKIFLM